ncbi:MAG: ATP-grasp domain-containing protein [Acidobacteria bacterium]|nr:ATP-grasp domain-containing protein [Acidobacteriota bacterium]
MPVVIYASPWFTENAVRFLGATAALDIRLGLITQEPVERLSPELRARIAAHCIVADAFRTDQLIEAANTLALQLGPIDRLLGAVEQLQVPLAEARAHLGLPGLSVEAAHNFRDKARMKTMLALAGLPCAHHRLVENAADAWDFAREIGYPLIVKPPAGAGAQSTYRTDDAEAFAEALAASAPSTQQPVLIEEFITGEEHSFETFSLEGRPVFHSLTHYSPTPLEVLRQPWIQWALLLPREIEDPKYDDIRRVAFRTLEVLGMQTGLSHLEWFRRRDGSIAISEVGARPPGAQITTLISRANDFDAVAAWAQLMIFDEFTPPERKYAAGAAYLRGQGRGRIRAIHGLDQAEREIGSLVTDVKLPEIGAEPSKSYEGDGYVILRHPDTETVRNALARLITLVRVELG